MTARDADDAIDRFYASDEPIVLLLVLDFHGEKQIGADIPRRGYLRRLNGDLFFRDRGRNLSEKIGAVASDDTEIDRIAAVLRIRFRRPQDIDEA